MTKGVTVHMVNGAVFHIALDIDDVAAAVTSVGDGCLIALHTGQDQGCAHLTQARLPVKRCACSLCSIDYLLA